MALHLIKLAVGCDSFTDLADWQAQRLADMRRQRQTPELMHITRQTPRRGAEVLDGGCLYWVIKGWISARQRIVELRPVVRDDIPHCALVLAPELMAVEPRPRRPFQGWRYFKPADVPPDSNDPNGNQMPEEMRRELLALGLL